MRPNGMLVFCDLDDTLSTGCNGAGERAARQRLEELAARVPVIVCSYRTRAEVELLQQELGVAHPFVCESGAAVVIPNGYFRFDVPHADDVAGHHVVRMGHPYERVVAELRRASARMGLRLRGFSDMSIDDVAREWNLPLLEARLAKLREYTEPFELIDPSSEELPRLLRVLAGAGVSCSFRRRFWHAGTIRGDFGVQFLCGLYRRVLGRVPTIAFGDHAGAAPILRGVDVPVVVQGDGIAAADLMRDAPSTARRAVVGSIGDLVEAITDVSKHASVPTRKLEEN